jgi:glycosyltransferase involved in cell wall biosynthesis
LVWTYLSDALPLLDLLPRACSLYWTGDEVVDPKEPQLLSRVDHVFAISPSAIALKRPTVEAKLAAMPMAIDPEPFIGARMAAEPPADLRNLRRPIIGYGGALSMRIDWDMLREVANKTAGTLVLVGPSVDAESSRELKDLSLHRSVVALGHRGVDEAPKYIAAFDAALIPYKRNAFNLGSNPVKFYEYLAAGLPVISVSLPALLPFNGVATFADGPSEFADAANLAAAATVDYAAVSRRQDVARAHSYENLIRRVEAHVEDGSCWPG